jgi:hypothetical protein
MEGGITHSDIKRWKKTFVDGFAETLSLSYLRTIKRQPWLFSWGRKMTETLESVPIHRA